MVPRNSVSTLPDGLLLWVRGVYFALESRAALFQRVLEAMSKDMACRQVVDNMLSFTLTQCDDGW